MPRVSPLAFVFQSGMLWALRQTPERATRHNLKGPKLSLTTVSLLLQLQPAGDDELQRARSFVLTVLVPCRRREVLNLLRLLSGRWMTI